jgi:predicted DNA-binding transcriptional regulator AlpA
MAIMRMSRTTLWRHVVAGHIPEPIKMGKTIRWHKITFENWVISHGIDITQKPITRPRRDLEEFA